MTFDVRVPGPEISVLASWDLFDVDSRRLSTKEIQLSLPLRDSPLTVEVLDDEGTPLLDLILKKGGPGRPFQLVGGLCLFAAYFFLRYLYKAVSAGDTAAGAAPDAAALATVVAIGLGMYLVGRLRRRRRFMNTSTRILDRLEGPRRS